MHAFVRVYLSIFVRVWVCVCLCVCLRVFEGRCGVLCLISLCARVFANESSRSESNEWACLWPISEHRESRNDWAEPTWRVVSWRPLAESTNEARRNDARHRVQQAEPRENHSCQQMKTHKNKSKLLLMQLTCIAEMSTDRIRFRGSAFFSSRGASFE